MKKAMAITVSVLFWIDEVKISAERTFLLPKKWMMYSIDGIIVELRKRLNKNDIYVLAFKYGIANMKTPICLKDFKEVRGVEVKDTSDWYIDSIFDKFEVETIDRRADPIILMIGDKKRLQHRISYYIDLINRGYSKEEALSYLY